MTLSIFDAARASPHAEALVCDGERLSFADLAARTQARMVELLALGVRGEGEQAIALVVDNSVAMFEILHALFVLGVPVLPIHPRLTELERQHLLALGRAQTLLDPAHARPARRAPEGPWPTTVVSPEHPFALVPSSGSTGTPKLVELSRRAFLALARADAARVASVPSDRALLCLPLSHVGGLSVVTRALQARRACVVFRPGPSGLLGSLPELAETLIRERVTLVSLVPPVLGRLLSCEPELATRAPLRAVLLGGQACSAELFARAREHALPVLTSYGLTEACSQVSTLGFPPPAQPPLQGAVVGVGFPLAGVELRIAAGQIQVRGPTLFTRYVGAPRPFDDAGYFDTGDRGDLHPELGLFVYGRASEVVITGGENVDPSEVELALLACGGLEAACVFGVPDAEFGERLAVALEVTLPDGFDEPALFAQLDRRLASFKQPRSVCRFEMLPRLASGKLDRPRIRREALERLRPADRARKP